jgi:ABC-type multidrug transport system permease subunit
MMIKSTFLYSIWIFVLVLFIINPLFYCVGILAVSVIELPSWLTKAILIFVIPLGCYRLVDLVYNAVRKIVARMSKEK